jgi:transposase
VALQKKVARPESPIACQGHQIDRQKDKIKKLNQNQRTLAEEVRKHKWDHILAKSKITRTKHKLEQDDKEIAYLRETLRIARLPQNSSNSSKPPSTDIYKPRRNKNYNLTQKTGRKPGSQPGHKGSTMKFCTDGPDQEIEHAVQSCIACGKVK